VVYLSGYHRTQKETRGGQGRTKGWFLEVLWATGERTWQTLTSLKDSNPYEVAQYAEKHGLLEEPAFSYWARQVLKKAKRWINAAKKRRKDNRYKYGVQIPRNMAHAIELDEQNGNKLWQDAIAKEMNTLHKMQVFEILKQGERAPKDYKRIPMWIIFDVKMDFRRKARLVAGGHVTDPPTWDTFSSVASRESVRTGFLLAALNDLELVSVDIGNAYVNATCREQLYTIAGPEFASYEGCVILVIKALYGLKSSGAAWHAHLSEALRDLGFTPSKADPDMWMREAARDDGSKYYEYIIAYVDDLIIVSAHPKIILTALEKVPYELKGGGAPATFLGASIGKNELELEAENITTWYMSAHQYLENAIKEIESRQNKKLPNGKWTTPLEKEYHPELDATAHLEDDDANFLSEPNRYPPLGIRARENRRYARGSNDVSLWRNPTRGAHACRSKDLRIPKETSQQQTCL
jgi:hypothetical protein